MSEVLFVRVHDAGRSPMAAARPIREIDRRVTQLLAELTPAHSNR